MVGPLTLRHKLFLARSALGVERLWPKAWPLIAAINLYAAFALYDGPRKIPGGASIAILAIWGGVVVWLGWRLRRAVQWPTEDEAARRLERDSGVSHHPLSVLSDRPAQGRGAALWEHHRRRMEAVVATLKPGWPRFAQGPAADPWGARFWAFVPLAFGLVVGWGDAPARMGRAFRPMDSSGPGFEAWVAPPAATGMAAWVLDPKAPETLHIPSGSVLRASAPAGWGRASVVVDGRGQDFDGDRDQHIETVLDQAHTLQIRRLFRTLGDWTVQTVPDRPPRVEFLRPPEADEKTASIRVGVEAADDYGLTRLWLTAQPKIGDAVEIDLPVSRDNPRSSTVESRIESDAGTLVGQTVTLTPQAQDSAGQIATGEAATLVWPQRRYMDPQAKILAEARKTVLDDPGQGPQVAREIDDISRTINDLSGILDLGLARRDLEAVPPDVADAQGLMLGAANRLEDRTMRRMQQKLSEMGESLDQALQQGNRDALKQLAERYADMLEKMAESDDQGGPQLPLNQDDIKEILSRLDQLAGQKADAKLRQRLERLAEKMAEKAEKMGRGPADPFGNQQGGTVTGDDDSTRIPGRNVQDGIGRILDDIRGRLMDGGRPKAERDYLKRLLDIPR